MARIEGVDPNHTQGPLRAVFEAQTRKWGAPLLNHLLYARRPTIFRGVRAMWTGLDSSGLVDGKRVLDALAELDRLKKLIDQARKQGA